MEGGSMNRKRMEIRDFHGQAIDDYLTEVEGRRSVYEGVAV